ncbi:phage replisome organizer N-terminal domain-containing protein [Lacicoccus qingdaonensis]|uniref:Phage replisome organizer, putative, N-terminal region n=1 Tax=Lacicoccus qingdaonensis TaxID=576118 RepID=A0A1G9F0N0_9BACL|nr:phage replisome organizer N-terminal domain-containing protein [Salinicoccus qingdaonensis]SDK81881.1 phage replisome organizer, putative, N-terminal region [Salinicoccus qingdaonensis]
MAQIQWIKLKVDMFDNEKIKLIEAMPDADSILVIWIKLLTYAGKTNSSGYILLTETIPMNEEEIATIFNRPLNTVRYALQVFERYGMINREDDVIKIKNWENHQNVEGMERAREQAKLRKRKQREREREAQNKMPESDQNKQSHVMSRDSHATEREREREEDLDKELDIEKEREEEKKDSLSYNQEVYDVLNKRGIDMSNAQACFKISQKMSGIDDIQYLHKAIDVADNKGVLKAPYVLRIIENWFEDGKTSYEALMQYENKSNKPKYGTPNDEETRNQYKNLGF